VFTNISQRGTSIGNRPTVSALYLPNSGSNPNISDEGIRSQQPSSQNEESGLEIVSEQQQSDEE